MVIIKGPEFGAYTVSANSTYKVTLPTGYNKQDYSLYVVSGNHTSGGGFTINSSGVMTIYNSSSSSQTFAVYAYAAA